MPLVGGPFDADALLLLPPHPASSDSDNNVSIGATALLRVNSISRVPFITTDNDNVIFCRPVSRCIRKIHAIPWFAYSPFGLELEFLPGGTATQKHLNQSLL